MSDIATASIEEALDFAFNLIMPVISEAGESDPVKAQEFLRQVSDYVSLRYAGELGLAFEWLQNFDNLSSREFPNRASQFQRQMNWLQNEFK